MGIKPTTSLLLGVHFTAVLLLDYYSLITFIRMHIFSLINPNNCFIFFVSTLTERFCLLPANDLDFQSSLFVPLDMEKMYKQSAVVVHVVVVSVVVVVAVVAGVVVGRRH